MLKDVATAIEERIAEKNGVLIVDSVSDLFIFGLLEILNGGLL